MNAPPLAVRFGKLHHQTGGEPFENGLLIIEDGRVSLIGDAAAQLPRGATTFEAACVTPGLINAHAHLEMSGEAQTTQVFALTTPTQRAYACADNARKALEAGVTTVRDLGGTERLAIDLRDALAAGRLKGPEILAAGSAICMTGGHGWFVGRQADGPPDVRKAVREQRRDGADCVKFIATGGVLTQGAVPGIAQLSEDELRAGIEEAHAHRMRAAAHAIGTEGIKNALRAGIDSIEHGHLIDAEGIELMLRSDAYLVPTLAAIRCIVEAGAEAGMPDFVLRKATDIAQHASDNLRAALRAGVRFAGGSDAGTPYNYHEAYWYELELMQTMLGMSARDALHATTVNGAALLGVQRGKIEPGAVADLLLLERDIERDVQAFRDPAVVIKGGAVVHDRRP